MLAFDRLSTLVLAGEAHMIRGMEVTSRELQRKRPCEKLVDGVRDGAPVLNG